MSKLMRYQMLFGIGAAAFAWWSYRQQQQRAARAAHHYGRGEVIFSNTPHPAEP